MCCIENNEMQKLTCLIKRYWDNNNAPKSDNPRSDWYCKSYPLIIKAYEKRLCCFEIGEPRFQAFCQRIAWLYSWNATIPKLTFQQCNMDAWINLESALEGDSCITNVNYENGTIKINNNSFSLDCIFDKLNAILGYKSTSIAIASKYLHFSFPNLFPMMDSNITKNLHLGNSPSKENYKKYFQAMKCFVSQNEKVELRAVEQKIFQSDKLCI